MCCHDAGPVTASVITCDAGRGWGQRVSRGGGGGGVCTYLLQDEHALGCAIAGHGQRDRPCRVVFIQQVLHNHLLFQPFYIYSFL